MTELEQKIAEVIENFDTATADYLIGGGVVKQIAGLIDENEIAKRKIEEYLEHIKPETDKEE